MAKKYKFSGHQTFVFRYGWLEKGVRVVAEYPDLFSRDDAMVILGVGKNMVESIRHWCQVAQLVEPLPGAARNAGVQLRPTEMAKRLLLDPGWDPFMEDDASLWLIHWLTVSNPGLGTSWNLLFSRFYRPDFTRRELADFISPIAENEAVKVSESVLQRDVDCLIRCYVGGSNGKKVPSPEESFDCPLIELNLIQPSPDGELYRFAIGPKSSLPAAVFAFALDQFFDREGGRVETMSIQKCLYGEGSPGQAFKLDENSLIEYVEDLERITEQAMILDETAGLKQIYRRNKFDGTQILNDYYTRSRAR